MDDAATAVRGRPTHAHLRTAASNGCRDPDRRRQPGAIDESIYTMSADSGSKFRIDSTACQYIYNLASGALGPGIYRVDILIGGNSVGSGLFALK